MSGETEKQISGWTTDTLRYYLMGLLDERELRYEQRFVAQEKAVSKAEMATEKRLEAVNEFRAQLADQASRLMPRAESDLAVQAINEKISVLGTQIDRREGDTGGKDLLTARMMSAVSLLIAIAAVAVAAMK